MLQELIALDMLTGGQFGLREALLAQTAASNALTSGVFFIGLYFAASFIALLLHSGRASITLAPMLAWSALLTFMVWQLVQIGWWVDSYELKINVAILGIIPAILLGSTVVYAMDGVRAARAYHVIVICSTAFSIGFSVFYNALGGFMPVPPVIFLSLSSQIALAGALIVSSIITNIFYEAFYRLNKLLAMPFGFIGGIVCFLPAYSFLTYGWDAGFLNIHGETLEYVYVTLPLALTLFAYGAIARHKGLMLPARPFSSLAGFGADADKESMRESILAAREQIGELRRLNQALSQEQNLRQQQMMHSPLATIELDRQGRITIFNEAAENLLAQPTNPLIIGSSIATIIPDFAAKIAREDFAKSTPRVMIQKNQDGHTRDIEFAILPIYEGQKVQGYCLLAEDVTAREVKAKKMLLSERVREIHKTGRVIHHDFSNLMLAIQSHLAALKAKPELWQNADLQNAWNAIFDASQRGKDMLAQFGAHQVFDRPELKPHRLKTILEEAVRIMTPAAKEKQLELSSAISDEAYVEIDATQMIRVFINLIGNAIRATGSGGTIHVTTQKQDESVLVRISDTGCGMNKEQLDAAFDPGFSTKGKGQGGLGLAISYLITEAHGGQLSLESAPEVGTTATIWLPLLKAETLSESDVVGDFAGEGVLLLVRDAELRRRLAEQFEEYGADVAELGNAEELQAVLEEDPDNWSVLVRARDEVMPPELWHRCRYLADVVFDPAGIDPARIRSSGKSRFSADDLRTILKAA